MYNFRDNFDCFGTAGQRVSFRDSPGNSGMVGKYGFVYSTELESVSLLYCPFCVPVATAYVRVGQSYAISSITDTWVYIQ